MTMIPIHLDLSEVVEEFALTGEQANELGANIISSIVTEYVSKWENLVNDGLRQTRKLYKRAMYVDRVSPTEVIFGLQAGEDGLALALEEGKDAYDEKPGFEASNKRKVKMDGGWYLTIPFRHATPDAIAESGIFQSVLPKEIYNIAKQNNGVPVKKAQLPPQYAQLGQRAAITTATGVIPSYTHKSPKYEGLVKLNIASTETENRSGYFTFRRVSNTSDPLSWIHPGFEPRKFMDKALEQAQIETVASMAIDKFLSQI
nr:MAG TPA: hypothetical protein [Herelleviridae sp.]DAT74246.1 MAG TPA: hypothetical protein [Herelleviridae sp.]